MQAPHLRLISSNQLPCQIEKHVVNQHSKLPLDFPTFSSPMDFPKTHFMSPEGSSGTHRRSIYKMASRGFTLIEVLIVLIILAVLATLTAQTIQRSTAVKTKLQQGIDHSSSIRNAVAVFERDIGLAFHYRDLNREVQEAIKKSKQSQPQDPNEANPPTPPPPPPEEEKPPPPKLTHFQGESQKVSFTSLAGVRVYPDAQESEQMEVSYSLRACKSYFQPQKEMQCLFRRTSSQIDEKLEEGGEEVAILENVTTFQLRYFGPGKSEDWVETWKTGEGSDDVTKDVFPFAVEITIESEERGKKLKLLSVAELRFPNNQEKKVTEGQTNAPTTDR